MSASNWAMLRAGVCAVSVVSCSRVRRSFGLKAFPMKGLLGKALLSLMVISAFLLHVPHATSFDGDGVPACGTVLISEDFESCVAGTWIGVCNDWQTWANGANPSYFFITDQEHVSGDHALHVAGLGTCWEGSAYKPFLTSGHILLKVMMKASGEGPVGCHRYQNGFDTHPALWSFEMPQAGSPGGLVCFAAGGGSHTAIEGFENAAGQWHAVATELNYDTGQARFWLDGTLVWSTPFDTSIPVTRVWLRSGEGHGWFDDVVVCQVEVPPPLGATLDFDPNTLNLESKGKYVTCYIELPEGYDPADIDVSTVMLNDAILAELSPTSVGDYDADGIPDKMVKFSRSELVAFLAGVDGSSHSFAEKSSAVPPIQRGAELEIMVTGQLTDGTPFSGADIIRVINPGAGAGGSTASGTVLVKVYPTAVGRTPRISYELTAEGPVSLRIFDAAGRVVRTLHAGNTAAGTHTVTWDRRTGNGAEVGSGLYFIRLEQNGRTSVQKLLILN